jgi:hypothetical protein
MGDNFILPCNHFDEIQARFELCMRSIIKKRYDEKVPR